MSNIPSLPYCVGSNNGTGSNTAPTSLSYSDSIPAGTTCTVIWLIYAYNSAPTVSVTVGGTSATSRTSVTWNPVINHVLACYALFTPSTGTQTISVTFSINTPTSAGMATAHYANAKSFGTASTVSAQTGSPMTISASSTTTARLYLNQLGYSSGVQGTISSYNRNQQILSGQGNGVGTSYPFVAGDAVGNGGTLTFSATRSDTARTYAGLIIPLIP